MNKKGGFVRPGSRAGIQDPRQATFITNLADLARQGSRPKPISAHTQMLSLNDLEEVDEAGPGGELPQAEAPAPISVASRMISFFAPKGGVGATTMAVNVAGQLMAMGRATVIADMDLQLGSVPTALNVKPQRSIAELVDEAVRDGAGPLQSGLDRHPSGLSMVAQGDRIEELGAVSVERLPRFFDALGNTFQYVVVDGLRDFSDHAVMCMDLAHLMVLVVTQDVPAVRAAARALRIFRRLGYGPDRISICLNRYHRKAPVTVEAIESALGQPVAFVVRNDFPLVEQSLNHGVMVAEVKPGAGLAGDLENLAYGAAGLEPPPPEPGLFARLFKRG